MLVLVLIQIIPSSDFAFMSNLPRGVAATAPPITPANNRHQPLLVNANGQVVRSLSTTPPSTTTRVDENTPVVIDVRRRADGEIYRRLLRLPGVEPRRSPSGRVLQIHGGPPSAIQQSPIKRTPYPSDRQLPSIRAARDQANDRPYLRALARSSHGPSAAFATSVRNTNAGSSSRPAPAAPSLAATRVRRHKPNTGKRTEAVRNMSEADLYLNHLRPPMSVTTRTHLVCGICGNLKSHPVAGECSHSYCYVCLHLWLQRSWRCPLCRWVLMAPPLRNLDSEHAIAFDHPEWIDLSKVNFSWEGFSFPEPTDRRRR
ncbi:hypothetical protein C8R46DRAFT_1213802 [Mycena filopes]|nr:hypothetical protein C8R46DRAFT_1213802 [Mycena filopes]